jgi:hypothetical protein
MLDDGEVCSGTVGWIDAERRSRSDRLVIVCPPPSVLEGAGAGVVDFWIM